MPGITAAIITFNEEDRIAEVIASLACCDEILVVDSGSTDRTEEIAKNGSGITKSNLVLAEILGSFDRIPLKLHASVYRVRPGVESRRLQQVVYRTKG